MANIVVTGLTAARMLAIEAASVVSGVVDGDNLLLTKHDGSVVDAGNVRGPIGPQGVPGGITISPASGDLAGNYPNPTIKDGAITLSKIAAAIKDAAANVASLRTLGDGPNQAAPGNVLENAETGWINCIPVKGQTPFAGTAVTACYYKKFGPVVHIRLIKVTTVAWDMRNYGLGNYPDTYIVGPGTLPPEARPEFIIAATAHMDHSPVGIQASPDGSIQVTGGFARLYQTGSTLNASFNYLTSS